jgi:hypothetical protein
MYKEKIVLKKTGECENEQRINIAWDNYKKYKYTHAHTVKIWLQLRRLNIYIPI